MLECLPTLMANDENTVNSDIMESLNEIQITGTEIPQEENENLLKMMFPPEKVQSFTMPRINSCCHISIFTIDSVWINDGNNLFLTNSSIPRRFMPSFI